VARGRIAIDPWLRVLGGDGKVFALGDCTCNTNNQLPATAQVAGQQGEHLGHLFSQCDMDLKDGDNNLLPPLKNLNDREELLAEKVTSFALRTSRIAAPFQFWNLGILAYTGSGSALAQLQVAPSDKAIIKGRGKIGFGLWRSVYLTKQISPRNRILVAIDWAKTKVFGRDITRTS
jgi:NADH dehydrogenase FAD-containing subunit